MKKEAYFESCEGDPSEHPVFTKVLQIVTSVKEQIKEGDPHEDKLGILLSVVTSLTSIFKSYCHFYDYTPEQKDRLLQSVVTHVAAVLGYEVTVKRRDCDPELEQK